MRAHCYVYALQRNIIRKINVHSILIKLNARKKKKKGRNQRFVFQTNFFYDWCPLEKKKTEKKYHDEPEKVDET